MNNIKIEDMPQMAFIDVTSICNLKCEFCYDFSEEKKDTKHPKLEKLLQIQNILADNGCKGIIYLGGEPSIYPNICRLLTHGNELGMWQQIITNGQKITTDMVKVFNNISNFTLGISLHDYRKDVYEKVTCVSGSYERVIKTIELVDANGINWYTQTSVLKDNYKRLYDLYKFLRQYKNLKYMDFSRMVSDGRGKHAENFLDITEWEEVFVTLNSIYEDGMDCIAESFPLCWLKKVCITRGMDFNIIKERVRPCRIFTSQIVLDYNGNIRMCPTGGHNMANIFETDLKEIWKNNVEINDYRNFKWLSKYCRDDSGPCKFFADCLGGCRRSKGGDNYSHDAYCEDANSFALNHGEFL